MSYDIILPTNGPTQEIPKGSILIACGRSRALLWRFDPRAGNFTDNCSQATGRGREITLDFEHTTVGYYDDVNGEIRLSPRGHALLGEWLGRRLYLDDLQSRDGLLARRREAKGKLMSGDIQGAFRLDRRGGL
jgi:hypothetical protein